MALPSAAGGSGLHILGAAARSATPDLARLIAPQAGPAGLYAGCRQPRHRDFCIARVAAGGRRRAVAATTPAERAFFAHRRFALADGQPRRDILLVPPLSGSFPILMRDLVLALLPAFTVHVVDWANVRHVDAAAGPFSFSDNVDAVVATARALPQDAAILGLCQGGVPALAAAAVLEAEDRPAGAVALLGAPIRPSANPTRVVRLVRSTPQWWLPIAAGHRVARGEAGEGRLVYPAESQLQVLLGYCARHFAQRGEIHAKLTADDGLDAAAFPFADMLTSMMDIDARHFVENLTVVFHRDGLAGGAVSHGGRRVDPRAIRRTRLITIEGAADDIAAPGQTRAAHDLCPALPGDARAAVVVPGCGHFSLFHGRRCRDEVAPLIARFCANGQAA